MHELEKQDELFELFCKHKDSFKIILDAGIFDIRRGKAILNFDFDGVLIEVKKETTEYKRQKKLYTDRH